jgi:KUP system potassium uptake protein
VAALGIVYGNIGTSPLYALKECFHGAHHVPLTHANVLGVLSLIVWSLVLVVSVKYLAFVMRADNDGEGGILALMALALQGKYQGPPRSRWAIVIVGLFGAALLYGDGVITPAISVLSAMEGLSVATPAIGEGLVQLISIGVLAVLFWLQKRGTAGIGRLFGPITITWFLTLAALGVAEVVRTPEVLGALNPAHAMAFFAHNGKEGFLMLGAVFLVVTGGEALYAELGHFGRRPIRLAWFALVLPALLLNYFGQGALLLRNPEAAHNPFYRLAPGWLLYPLVGLATAATVIASQAMISGAFSLTRQAMQLGYMPRVGVEHTSEKEIGQIYISTVNWLLFAAVVLLVLAFKNSTNLAGAYGIAVSTTMVITALLAYVVAAEVWRWNRAAAVAVVSFFLLIDLAFFGANLAKVLEGGWFSLVVGAGVFTLMTTWKRGREILNQKLRAQSLPLEYFLLSVAQSPPPRVPGVAVFMTSSPEGAPPALLHNLKHNKVLHQKVVLLTVLAADVPRVAAAQRVEIQRLEQDFYRVVARYGFIEDPSVPEILELCRAQGLELKMMETTFFLGRETLIPTRQPGMALWREALFAWMSRNARSATSFFRIPPNRVVELGAQIEL